MILDKTELWEKGNRRLRKVAKEYREKDCFVVMREEQKSGVDLEVFSADGKLQKVIECTNYAHNWEYIDGLKLKRYIDTLNLYDALPDVVKELHVSYSENLSRRQKKLLAMNNIEVVVWGCQD